MAEQVLGWRSVDGKLHETEREAEKVDARYEIRDWCRANLYSEITPSDVADFIFDGAEVLLPMLEKVVGKNPKGTKPVRRA